jgi:hypothetical protein
VSTRPRFAGRGHAPVNLVTLGVTMTVPTLGILVLVAAVFTFLRTGPRPANPIRVRRFNRQVLGYLGVLSGVVLGLFVWRIDSVESVAIGFAYFLVGFVPMYLLGAGLLRSRLFSSFHGGGRTTV